MTACDRTAPLSRRLPLQRPWRRLLDAIALQRTRRRLVDLDDHTLRDIGLSREQAEAEGRRPVWDAPLHWRR
ncbi:MAG: DUF1127 domain-containing protein [Gemmobacter sp.]